MVSFQRAPTVQELLQHQVPAAFRASVLGRLDRGDLDWPQYRKAVAHLAPTVKDFAGLVLQEKLNWTMGPFQLKHGR